MVYGLWHSAAGLQAQDYRQGIIANNLANANTPGFKPDRVAFQDRLNAAQSGNARSARFPSLDLLTGGLFSTPVYTDFSDGAAIPTDNPFDVAIQGGGFLNVQTPDGVRYTRDGRMIKDRDGTLRHLASGGTVLDASGGPIRLEDNGKPPKIDATGTIRQGDTQIGRLALTDFAERDRLQKIGDNLYSGEQARPIEAGGTLRQGFIEGSGVEPTTSLVEMIATSRAYEINAQMIRMQDQTISRAVNDVGRIG